MKIAYSQVPKIINAVDNTFYANSRKDQTWKQNHEGVSLRAYPVLSTSLDYIFNGMYSLY